jgi:hypothetical protein
VSQHQGNCYFAVLNLITGQQSVVCKRDSYCGFWHHGTLHSGKRLADFWRNIGCLQVNPFAFECSCVVVSVSWSIFAVLKRNV